MRRFLDDKPAFWTVLVFLRAGHSLLLFLPLQHNAATGIRIHGLAVRYAYAASRIQSQRAGAIALLASADLPVVGQPSHPVRVRHLSTWYIRCGQPGSTADNSLRILGLMVPCCDTSRRQASVRLRRLRIGNGDRAILVPSVPGRLFLLQSQGPLLHRRRTPANRFSLASPLRAAPPGWCSLLRRRLEQE